MIDIEGQANIGQYIVTYTAPKNFCIFPWKGSSEQKQMFRIQSPTSASAVLTRSVRKSCGYSAEIYYINRLEKADVLSKISCYHSDFYGTMQFSVHLPDIFLPNKYMFHVKHIATNIYRIRILKLYQKCPRQLQLLAYLY